MTADDCEMVNCSVLNPHGEQLEESCIPFDGTDTFREQFYVTADRVLKTEGSFPDEAPEITKFAQEILVPGSTR